MSRPYDWEQDDAMLEVERCGYCGHAAVSRPGLLCVRCVFDVQSEVDSGMQRLGAYLRSWAKFREWEQACRL